MADDNASNGVVGINVPGPSGIGAKYAGAGGAPGGVATASGGTPPSADIPRQNPFDFPDEWGDFVLSGWTATAMLESVDGLKRPYEWAVQKGTGTGGATTVFRGEKVCESIKTVFTAPTKDHFDGFYELRKRCMPAPRGKPPTLLVRNPAFAFVQVDRIALKEIGAPKPGGKLGWQIEIEWIESRPSQPAKVGPTDPAKLPGDPKPQDALDKQIDDLRKQLGK